MTELVDHPWPFWLGGIAVGGFVILMAWVTGKALGVSTGMGSLCGLVSGLTLFRQKPYSDAWRLWFVLGIPLGGLASATLSGHAQPRWTIGTFETLFGDGLPIKALVLIAGGFLIGYGSRWAGG